MERSINNPQAAVCVDDPQPPTRSVTLGAPEGVVIVVVITLAAALVILGMSTTAVLELLGGAGLVGVQLLKQVRA